MSAQVSREAFQFWIHIMTVAENDVGMSDILSPEDEDESAEVAMLESLWKDASEEQDVTPVKKKMPVTNLARSEAA